ncbi:MAG: D-aminoacyl-tRNA deacylase [Nanoarchaeota archaeon]
MMQKIAIIASSKDPAGINIRNNLIGLFDFRKLNDKFNGNEVYEFKEINDKIVRLHLTNNDLIFSENIDGQIDADTFIFASKHRSKENTQSFTVHGIGNWNNAEMGGSERKLCQSSAVLMKNIFLELNENAKQTNYQTTMEVTHHGPYVEKPAIFVEIGSTEKEWGEKTNGEIIAKTIMNSLQNENKDYKIAVGIGGTHYCANFNKIMLRSDVAFSYVCPKYALNYLDEEMINQAITKTKEKADFAVLDWKGLGTEKKRIVEMLEKLGIKAERTDKILKD